MDELYKEAHRRQRHAQNRLLFKQGPLGSCGLPPSDGLYEINGQVVEVQNYGTLFSDGTDFLHWRCRNWIKVAKSLLSRVYRADMIAGIKMIKKAKVATGRYKRGLQQMAKVKYGLNLQAWLHIWQEAWQGSSRYDQGDMAELDWNDEAGLAAWIKRQEEDEAAWVERRELEIDKERGLWHLGRMMQQWRIKERLIWWKVGWVLYKQEGEDVLALCSTMAARACLNCIWGMKVESYKYRQQSEIEVQWQESKARNEVEQHATRLQDMQMPFGLFPMADEATPG